MKELMNREKKRERKVMLDDMVKDMKEFADIILKSANEIKKDKQKQKKEKLDDISGLYL